MLLVSCVNTPIKYSMFQFLHTPVARCSVLCERGLSSSIALRQPGQWTKLISITLLSSPDGAVLVVVMVVVVPTQLSPLPVPSWPLQALLFLLKRSCGHWSHRSEVHATSLGPVHTGCGSTFACKSFDVASKLCEHSRWPQCVSKFAYACCEVLRVLCERGLNILSIGNHFHFVSDDLSLNTQEHRRCLHKTIIGGVLLIVLLFLVGFIIPVYIKGFPVPVQGKTQRFCLWQQNLHNCRLFNVPDVEKVPCKSWALLTPMRCVFVNGPLQKNTVLQQMLSPEQTALYKGAS